MTTSELLVFTLFVITLGYILGIITTMIIKRHKVDGRIIIDQMNPEEDFMRLELDADTVGDMAQKDQIILKIVNKN